MGINKTAFTYTIAPNASGINENVAIHQSSPAWVLTFLRWSVRDTLRTNPTETLNYSTIPEAPLVVENDCLQLSISDSKSVLTPSLSATLIITDINYETAISPGDFVFANMLNWESHARKVADKARARKPINGVDDGFKGFFKVQSVRKNLVSDPVSGIKMYIIKITAFAFTEFNNSIYFNPYLIGVSDKNLLLFASLLGIDWALIQNDKGLTQIQTVLKALIVSFVGSGLTDQGKKVDTSGITSPNIHFFMPQGVGELLGLTNLQSAKDAYNYLFGIQTYSSGESQSLAQGMNPSGISADATDIDRFILVPGRPCEGFTVAKPEYWNQVKAWAILNQFRNAPLNELYTCFRISPNGSIMPTMVLRQIPFTTDGFDAAGHNVTRFMNVPRWDIDPALALAFDLGKDEIARINFVQYYGRSINGPAGYDISDETARQNYLYDIDDVKRNGLRPYVVTSEFDRASNGNEKTDFRSPGWARIVGDALIGGHLKLSGTITFIGIEDPIAVGDNLQFDNVVYHIEQISHTGVITQDGKKTFTTSITVSNGMALNNGQDVKYPEMKFSSAYDERKDDYNNSQILPGVSESQDVEYREGNLDVPHSKSSSFVQPDTNTSINKSKR